MPQDHDKPTKLIALRQVPALPWLPSRRAGAKLATATVIRWAQHGVAGRMLRTVRVGGTMCTTEAWLMEFFAAGAPVNSGQTTEPYTPARRKKQIEKAKSELAAAGY